MDIDSKINTIKNIKLQYPYIFIEIENEIQIFIYENNKMKLQNKIKVNDRIRYFCNIDENNIIVLTGSKSEIPSFFTSKYEEYDLKLISFVNEKDGCEKDVNINDLKCIEMYLRGLNNKMDKIVEKIDLLSDRVDKIEFKIDNNNK